MLVVNYTTVINILFNYKVVINVFFVNYTIVINKENVNYSVFFITNLLTYHCRTDFVISTMCFLDGGFQGSAVGFTDQTFVPAVEVWLWQVLPDVIAVRTGP